MSEMHQKMHPLFQRDTGQQDESAYSYLSSKVRGILLNEA